MDYLVLCTRSGAELKRFSAGQSRVVIGRANGERVPSSTNGYLDSPIVSRAHAEIDWSDDTVPAQCMIVDLGSTHGTAVIRDGRSRQLFRSQPFRLEQGDIVVFGKPVADGPSRRIEAIDLCVVYQRPSSSTLIGLLDDEMLLSDVEQPPLDEDPVAAPSLSRSQPLIMQRQADLPELDKGSSDAEESDDAALKTSPVVPTRARVDVIDDDDDPFGSVDEDELILLDIGPPPKPIAQDPDITFSMADVTDAFAPAFEAQPVSRAIEENEASSTYMSAAPAAPPSSQPIADALCPNSPQQSILVAPASVLGKRARTDELDGQDDQPAPKVARPSPSAGKLVAAAALGVVGGAVAAVVGLASLGPYLD